MAAQKCKNILLQAALKDFWLSASWKLKKSTKSLSKFHFFMIICSGKKKKSKKGGSWELLKWVHCEFSQKNEPWRSTNL